LQFNHQSLSFVLNQLNRCRLNKQLTNMSKNNNSNQFRRINIDAFDPENYIDDDQGLDEELGPNESEVVGLLNS